MSDKGMFSGMKWHNEWHAVDRKKDKAANCEFLTEDRICTNPKSVQYTEKCFVASTCKFRKKHNELDDLVNQLNEQKKQQNVRYKCTLPKGCVLVSAKLGQGRYVDYCGESNSIYMEFPDKTRSFVYPEVLLEGKLKLQNEDLYSLVSRDIEKAEVLV